MIKRLLFFVLFSCCTLSGCSRGTEVPESTEIIEQETEDIGVTLSAYLDNIPEDVLQAVFSYGYTIQLVDSIDEEYGLKYVSGITIPETKQIILESNDKKFRQTVAHEVFHAFDDYLGFISDEEEFRGIYEAEKDLMQVTGYLSAGQHKASPKEYFAEACQMYIYDAETLKESAPRTYSFIDDLLKGEF